MADYIFPGSRALICSDCKTLTEVIYDHEMGMVICTRCGLVLCERCIFGEWGAAISNDLFRACQESCVTLGMRDRDMTALAEALKKVEELDEVRGSSSESVMAAVVYMIARLSNDNLSLQDVSQAARVAEGIIKRTYKVLYPYASRIIPNWYGNVEDLKKLCTP